MTKEWLAYIQRFDDLIQEALKSCAKNSLQTIFTSLHGNGSMGPTPLIKMDIDLSNNKVKYIIVI